VKDICSSSLLGIYEGHVPKMPFVVIVVDIHLDAISLHKLFPFEVSNCSCSFLFYQNNERKMRIGFAVLDG
jgi:hypothetical protein